MRVWAQAELAVVFDELRKLDAGATGVLTPKQVMQGKSPRRSTDPRFTPVFRQPPTPLPPSGFRTCRIPAGTEELETLAMSMDFLGDQQIHYCCMPKVLKCYGGGLMVGGGGERGGGAPDANPSGYAP